MCKIGHLYWVRVWEAWACLDSQIKKPLQLQPHSYIIAMNSKANCLWPDRQRTDVREYKSSCTCSTKHVLFYSKSKLFVPFTHFYLHCTTETPMPKQSPPFGIKASDAGQSSAAQLKQGKDPSEKPEHLDSNRSGFVTEIMCLLTQTFSVGCSSATSWRVSSLPAHSSQLSH